MNEETDDNRNENSTSSRGEAEEATARRRILRQTCAPCDPTDDERNTPTNQIKSCHWLFVLFSISNTDVHLLLYYKKMIKEETTIVNMSLKVSVFV